MPGLKSLPDNVWIFARRQNQSKVQLSGKIEEREGATEAWGTALSLPTDPNILWAQVGETSRWNSNILWSPPWADASDEFLVSVRHKAFLGNTSDYLRKGLKKKLVFLCQMPHMLCLCELWNTHNCGDRRPPSLSHPLPLPLSPLEKLHWLMPQKAWELSASSYLLQVFHWL